MEIGDPVTFKIHASCYISEEYCNVSCSICLIVQKPENKSFDGFFDDKIEEIAMNKSDILNNKSFKNLCALSECIAYICLQFDQATSVLITSTLKCMSQTGDLMSFTLKRTKEQLLIQNYKPPIDLGPLLNGQSYEILSVEGPISTKVALITGGASKIGSYTTRILHKEGYCVAIHYHASSTKANSLTDELNSLRKNSAIAIQRSFIDNCQNNALELIEQVIEYFGRLDVLVNNASTYEFRPLENVTEHALTETMNVNMNSYFFLIKESVKYLKSTKGTVVNMGDVHGFLPKRNFTSYCMSKSGVLNLTKCMALELAEHDITVNCINPGAIYWVDGFHDAKLKNDLIKRIPLKRRGDWNNVTDTIIFLIKNRFITGQMINVDGGESISNEF